MKETFIGCYNAIKNRRTMSLYILYCHVIFFFEMLLMAMMPMSIVWFSIFLVFISVFIAGIVSVHTNKKKFANIILTMAYLIVFLIAFTMGVLIVVLNINMISFFSEATVSDLKRALDEFEKNPSRACAYGFVNPDLSYCRDVFNLGITMLENKKMTFFVVNVIAINFFASYVNAAWTIKSYNAQQLKQNKPQPSAIVGLAPAAAEKERFVVYSAIP